MARKTVSIQKRLKKKISAQTKNKSTRNSITYNKSAMDRDREGKESGGIDENNVELQSSSMNRDRDLERNEPQQQSQHENHQDDQVCNCFLRRGQMFLPPSMIKSNNNNA